MTLRQDALDYHQNGRKGKMQVVPTKPCVTSRDLSLAYSPGVAEPCREIHKNKQDVFRYTAKGNLVAVVSNGSAVLGLGNIGAEASKPVMEGKGVLFKRFADIDVFDIELDTEDPDEIIRVCEVMQPTFGGINLEDIKAPECFYIEDELKKRLSIPVFHDDQHGTAIIGTAGLLNALDIVGKSIDSARIVINGAGAAGIACARLMRKLGACKSRMLLVDSRGVVHPDRTEGMNPYKEEFCHPTEARTLADALDGADVFFGVSTKDVLTADMLKTMAKDPIIFAMANPDPEILPDVARAARPDAIIGTGRSDFPNQVNNVLCFPFLFRGALDVGATAINDAMLTAAVRSLAQLAREEVPESVVRAYGGEKIVFGRDYLIPKPFDSRVLLRVAPAVAEAAMKSGVARMPLTDLRVYREQLEALQGRSKEIMRLLINKAICSPKRLVFPEGDDSKIIGAARILVDEGIAKPILLGPLQQIQQKAAHLGLSLDGIELIDPDSSPRLTDYGNAYFEARQRKGAGHKESLRKMRKNRNYYGAMMVEQGDADALVSGLSHNYPETIRPALEVIGKRDNLSKVHGCYMMVFEKDVLFLADTTVNIEPEAEEMAETAILTAEQAMHFNIDPRVAMLSFSNFGSTPHPLSAKVKRATEIVKRRRPDLTIDGEMQANAALDPELCARQFPFSQIQGDANVLIFPDLQSGNIAYKLLAKAGGATAVGPILLGMSKPVHVLQQGDDIPDIINMSAVAVVDAQMFHGDPTFCVR